MFAVCEGVVNCDGAGARLFILKKLIKLVEIHGRMQTSRFSI